jgi:hypothetical protein
MNGRSFPRYLVRVWRSVAIGILCGNVTWAMLHLVYPAPGLLELALVPYVAGLSTFISLRTLDWRRRFE